MNSSTTSRYPRPPPAGKDNDERDRGRDCLFTGIRSVSYTIAVSSSTSFSLRAHTTTVSTTGRCSFGQSNLTKQSTSSLTHVPYISTAQHGTQLLFICSYIDISISYQYHRATTSRCVCWHAAELGYQLGTRHDRSSPTGRPQSFLLPSTPSACVSIFACDCSAMPKRPALAKVGSQCCRNHTSVSANPARKSTTGL